MITALDSRVMDANAEALGVSVETLMGNAGKAIADYILTRHPGKRIGICCGHGNNGGDGFAAACYLKESDVQIFLIRNLQKIKSPTVRHYLEMCGIKPRPFNECNFDFDILVDCGLGTGLSGDLRPEYSEYVSKVNSYQGTVIAVDVPTGLGTPNRVNADETVVMHDLKEGMNQDNCGRITVADIDMPQKAYTETGPGDMLRYPIPKEDSHKGNNGNLLIIGGGPYFGAPAMSAMSALRVGTDLVTIATPESSYSEIAAVNPTLMVHRLSGDHFCKEHIEDLLPLVESVKTVLIGPGLGKHSETVEAVREFVSKCPKPMVIDADALNALGTEFVLPHKNVILTPHHREFERIGGSGTDSASVSALSSKMNCTILLKGRTDIISDGAHTRCNNTGCAGMTGAGTGDVLAGITAGLLSKQMPVFDAAVLAAYISGKAGEYAFEELSYGMIATDIIDRIPEVLRNGIKTGR